MSGEELKELERMGYELQQLCKLRRRGSIRVTDMMIECTVDAIFNGLPNGPS